MKAFNLKWMRQRQTDRPMYFVADLTIGGSAATVAGWLRGTKARESGADDSADVTGCRVGTN